MVETFKEILKFTQPELKNMVTNYLERIKYKPVVGDGFVYAKGEIPIMLVAHLDTVHKEIPKEIYYDKEQDVMWSPQGIGGDDRCGVYSLLKILETHKPYVLFLEDEEIGCVGASKVIDVIVQPDVKYIVELDRRGKNDCVFYECGNKDFQEYVEKFGFELEYGSFTDICVLSDYWEIASVNLSIGYYKEHTTNETIKLEQMKDTIEKVKKMLDDEEKIDFQDYQKAPRFYHNTKTASNDFYDYYNYDLDDYYGYGQNDTEIVKDDKKADDLLKISDTEYVNVKTGEFVEKNDI